MHLVLLVLLLLLLLFFLFSQQIFWDKCFSSFQKITNFFLNSEFHFSLICSDTPYYVEHPPNNMVLSHLLVGGNLLNMQIPTSICILFCSYIFDKNSFVDIFLLFFLKKNQNKQRQIWSSQAVAEMGCCWGLPASSSASRSLTASMTQSCSLSSSPSSSASSTLSPLSALLLRMRSYPEWI